MRTLFILVLILNLITEALAATALIGGILGGSAEAQIQGTWAMHYGFAVIAIASALFWVWPYRDQLEAVTAVLGVLVTFHCSVFVSLAIAGDQPVGVVIHAILATLCIVLFTQRSRWCSSREAAR
jgi:hypothetical protein